MDSFRNHEFPFPNSSYILVNYDLENVIVHTVITFEYNYVKFTSAF